MKLLILLGLLSLSLALPLPDSADDYGYEECDDIPADEGWWPWSGKPKSLDSICSQYECPKFEKLNSSSCGFEARTYAGGVVVSTYVSSDHHHQGSDSFKRLFSYIRGENDQGIKIAMTSPVVTRTYYTREWAKIRSTMHFFVPAALADNVPKPTGRGVWIETWGNTTTYDRAFGGFDRSEKRIVKEFGRLCKSLVRAGVMPTVKHHVALTAGYTMPFYGQQREEVMLIGESEENTTDAFWEYEE